MTHEQADDPKDRQLGRDRVDDTDATLTTQQGVQVDHTDDSLSIGERGPTIMEDFHAREKLTHFDHERIPERVVHARGAGAYGHFKPYDSWLSEYTSAGFLTDPARQTPVFVRFSTVAGSRGSADTVRDVRGFATKFYTRQGNYDLVGNNMPVFFIQDGVKFPDFVHAVKPEPHNEIPQAASAHDTLWDFVSLQPETLHMILWLMSDRALPRSYRMMQGFGVHTFRLVNAEGRGTFVKFHWTPKLGTHSLVWDEAQKIAGKDPDFNRRDLWDSIEAGEFPEWELGVQLVDEADESEFDFDLLDATKLIPEERVPVRPVGRMVLDRNPDNFFAETEQVAFHTANLVPGIDFSNDPLLQARNFSYLDTQLIRLGGPNFAQLPVNRPVAEVHNDQRDGYGQHRIHTSRTSYTKNTLSGGCPVLADSGAFSHYAEKIEGHKIRERSDSFKDFYSQATLFWNSMSEVEAEHLVAAFRFELGKVEDTDIRARVVEELNHVDHSLARRVAEGVGVEPPAKETTANHGRSSAALSQLNTRLDQPATRKVAILVADGVDGDGTERLVASLRAQGLIPEKLAPTAGSVRAAGGGEIAVDRAINTMASVLYDGVAVPCGSESVATLSVDGYALHFVAEAYKHAKPIACFGSGLDMLRAAGVNAELAATTEVTVHLGVVTTTAARDELPDRFTEAFAAQLAAHRVWERNTDTVPA
ncbi:catalase [Stackebrandtia nassauensis]|uniref:Catalase n=1 Tax=Stackebrandtia nassauensis (strain DSM 44728 / CIP 108903 / NRRL B-16338 / NBRC 102104 / LLR-40K-21) TaxID=446470 RepID=D3PUS0_STANL|nr:catalase [Stackebrandtia nassauensis]ADD44944.1 Catalase [Stackebrandtia nassauensis DSM 44728]